MSEEFASSSKNKLYFLGLGFDIEKYNFFDFIHLIPIYIFSKLKSFAAMHDFEFTAYDVRRILKFQLKIIQNKLICLHKQILVYLIPMQIDRPFDFECNFTCILALFVQSNLVSTFYPIKSDTLWFAIESIVDITVYCQNVRQLNNDNWASEWQDIVVMVSGNGEVVGLFRCSRYTFLLRKEQLLYDHIVLWNVFQILITKDNVFAIIELKL